MHCFRIFLTLPSVRPKKPIITYDRLLLNIKLKKEKERTAIKELMLTPKGMKQQKLFNFKALKSPENKQTICSTDRRLEYSIQLKRKIIQKNLAKRNSYDFDVKDNFQNHFPLSLLIKSLTVPVSRLFFSIFMIKKNKKCSSFSILAKPPLLSPRLT